MQENKQGKQIFRKNPAQSKFFRHRSHHNMTWDRTPDSAVGGSTLMYRLSDIKKLNVWQDAYKYGAVAGFVQLRSANCMVQCS
jgi:hypothetical protein